MHDPRQYPPLNSYYPLNRLKSFSRVVNEIGYAIELGEMKGQKSTSYSVVDLVRDASVSRLKSLSGREDITLSDILGEPLVFAHWMSFILISGEALRITFKAHFMSEVAQFFAAKNYGGSKEDISLSRALDFFREYCNLTAGKIKVDLQQNQIQVGASLPGLIRGFDEIFYLQQKGATKSFWRLNCEAVEFTCSTHIEFFEQFGVNKLDDGEKATQGEVEYL